MIMPEFKKRIAIICDEGLDLSEIIEENELFFNDTKKRLLIEANIDVCNNDNYFVIDSNDKYLTLRFYTFYDLREDAEGLKLSFSKEDRTWFAYIGKLYDKNSRKVLDKSKFKFLLEKRTLKKFKEYIFNNYILSETGELRNKDIYAEECYQKNKSNLKAV